MHHTEEVSMPDLMELDLEEQSVEVTHRVAAASPCPISWSLISSGWSGGTADAAVFSLHARFHGA
jgi:hypothetical protein